MNFNHTVYISFNKRGVSSSSKIPDMQIVQQNDVHTDEEEIENEEYDDFIPENYDGEFDEHDDINDNGSEAADDDQEEESIEYDTDGKFFL